MLAHPLSIASSNAAAAIEHGQFRFVGIDILLLGFGVRHHQYDGALQVGQSSQSAGGVLFGARPLLGGQIGPCAGRARALDAGSGQRGHQPKA
ncbi:hypothetical protein ASD34_24360 [Variovorax sp. Root473]|nr:hypothetical protein ASD34_24360 [Variovorax sp. Root473]